MRRTFTRKRALLAAVAILAAGVLALVLLAPAAGLADTLTNISPASPGPAGRWMGRYPISRYQIDQYFPAISVSLLGGIDISGLMPMVAYAAAQVIWLITAFTANTVITVFQFAFNLNLLTGEGGGVGALAPVSQAIHNIYASTFGQPWLVAAIAVVGIWAMWKALVQRRYTQTTAALLTSLVYCVVALGIVARPAQTIAPLSQISNETSRAFLSLTDNGTLSEGDAAESSSSGQLFQTLILNPWTVLEFGGIDHCVNAQGRSAAVQPLSRSTEENAKLASRLEETTEVQAEGKQCIDNREKYAPHFLAYPYQTTGRNAEYEALKTGEDSKLPSSDPAKSNGSYTLGKADEPAAQAAGEGSQYERLLIAILLFVGELGVWVLLAGLAAGVILAQILLLLLLAFAPVALIAAVFPGRGHAYFVGWVSKMLGYLARKAIYSLVLAILLVVCQALQAATSSLGWLMSFLLQAVFCWTVLLQRHRLTSGLASTFAGASASEERGAGKLQTLYYATRLTQIAGLGHKDPPPVADEPKQRRKDSQPAPGRGSTTPTSTVSRPGTTAPTSESSRLGTSSHVGRNADAGVSTPTSPVALSAPDRAGAFSPARPLPPSTDRAGANPQKPAPRTPTSYASRLRSATSSTRLPRAASSTQTSRPRAGSTTATSQPQMPARRSTTTPRAPARPRSRPAKPAPPPLPVSPAAATTSTSSASRGASKTNTRPPLRANGPKETK